MLEDDYRLFNCQRCQRQVRICRHCDCGNVYCSDDCSRLGRRESVRSAGARYQRTRRGAQFHAARQSVWRERQRQKVTHHRFPTEALAAKVVTEVIREIGDDDVLDSPARNVVRCDFCRRPLAPFARLAPVRRPHRVGTHPSRTGWF